MNKRLRGVALIAVTMSGCNTGSGVDRPQTVAADGEPIIVADWRRMATLSDRERLRNWRSAWAEALPKAKAEDAAGVAREGALFQPDLALKGSDPPAGGYRCRVFKLGAKGTAMRDFIGYPYFDCRVDQEGDVRSLYKTSGSQRPVGLILDDSEARSVFLGTLMLGDEQAPLTYGSDGQRDMAGFVERIGDKRWRVVLPYPHFESVLDVVELVPKSPS